MADKHESAVQLAIARAASHYALREWFELPSSQRTRAIYCELQQLDAAAAGRFQEATNQSAPVRTSKSRSVAQALSVRHRASAKSERILVLTVRLFRRAHSSSSPG